MAVRRDSLPETPQTPLPDPDVVAKPQDYREHFTVSLPRFYAHVPVTVIA